jgi:predicted dehydrogenase
MTRRALLLASLAAPALAAPPSPRIRIAQLGTEHAHASGKLAALRSLADLYEVVGISGKPQTAEVYAGLEWRTEDQLLSDKSLQAVAIETRMEDSCRTAMKALQAGKSLHLDKPGALHHAEFLAMRSEAEKLGLTVQMGYMLRYNPAFQLLQQAVHEGWLGDILEIDASIGKLADAPTRQGIGALAGGGMFELACHVIDAAVALLGKPRAVHAISTPSRDDGVKDNQLAVLEYARATATIRCNHSDPFGGPHRRFAVVGSKGAMEIVPLESGRATLSLTEAHGSYRKGAQAVELKVPKGRYDEEFIDLAKVLRGEKKLAWDAAHDIAVHETVLRAAGVWE